MKIGVGMTLVLYYLLTCLNLEWHEIHEDQEHINLNETKTRESRNKKKQKLNNHNHYIEMLNVKIGGCIFVIK